MTMDETEIAPRWATSPFQWGLGYLECEVYEMTRILELTPEQEAVLARKAARAGMSVDDYLKRVIDKIIKINAPSSRNDFAPIESKRKSIKDIIEFLESGATKGIFSEDIDSLELARKLRAEAEHRQW